jgi:hypothetical protein
MGVIHLFKRSPFRRMPEDIRGHRELRVIHDEVWSDTDEFGQTLEDDGLRGYNRATAPHRTASVTRSKRKKRRKRKRKKK